MPKEGPLNPLQKAKAKNYYERSQIAKQVRAARAHESNPGEKYDTNRGMQEYYYALGGLNHYLDYVKTLKSNIVLDIGACTGRAMHQLSQTSLGDEIDFQVTALKNEKNLRQNFPKGKVHITPVEILRGIQPESVGGVLSMVSITYSEYPKIAIDKINEVLVPGGIVKGAFPPPSNQVGKYGLARRGPELFIERLKELGYDVASSNNKFTSYKLIDKNRFVENIIVVAIKPGNPSAPRAEDLINMDIKDRDQNQSNEFMGLKVFEIED